MESSGLAALDTTGSVSITLHINGSNVLYRAVTGNSARDTLGKRVHVWVLVGVVELVRLAPDGGSLDVAVGSSQGSGAKQRKRDMHDGYV